MANIRDVAKKAGVAACTVSRVLNGTGYISLETREKIERAMKELDYIPNELARGMFKQKAGIIAMLVPSIKHPFFSSLANYIEIELYKRGYKLMLCSTNDNINQEKDYLDILKSNIVDGVIMGVSNLSDLDYEQFQNPLVMLDYKVNNDIPVVTSNHTQGGAMAAKKFIDSKCKSVIHVGSSNSSKVESFKSHKVLRNKLNSSGIKSKFIEVNWNEFDFDEYLKMAKRILSEDTEIDGIMAADLTALAFLKAAMQLGRNVTEEFCVVAYDGTFITNTSIIDVTTVVQPIEQIAIKAVDVLLDRIGGKKRKKNSYILDVSLIQGQTTK